MEFKENIESSNMFIKTDLEESSVMFPLSRMQANRATSAEKEKSMQRIKEIS